MASMGPRRAARSLPCLQNGACAIVPSPRNEPGRWPRDLDIGVLNRSLMWYENQHTDDGRRHPTPPWMAETLEIMNGMFTIYQGISQPSTVSTPKSSLCCKGISGWDFMETDTSRNKTSFSFDCGSRLSIRTLCGWWCKVPYFMII